MRSGFFNYLGRFFVEQPVPVSFYDSDYMISSGFETVYGPCAFYDAAEDRTYVSWQFANPAGLQNKGIRIAYYDHATSTWSDRVTVGNFGLENDDHGAPAIIKDDDGYLYAFYAAHVTTQKWSVSNAPDDISRWTKNSPLSGNVSYPIVCKVGSTIYLFNRNDNNTSRRTGVVRSGTPSAGSLTFGSMTTLVDFETFSRFYSSEHHVVGTKIHFASSYANATDTFRRHVYYFVYNTATGALENFDNSFSTASGSLPVLLTSANTNYRIVDSGSDDADVPSLQFDSSGRPHLLFSAGAGDPYDLLHMYLDSGAWSTPVVVAQIPDNFPMFGYNDSYQLIAASSDEMWALYHDASANMVRKVFNGTAWGAEEVLVTATTYPFKQGIAAVAFADPALRALFAENADWATDADAVPLKLYAYGDSGFPSASIDMTGADPDFNDTILQLDFGHKNNATTLIDYSNFNQFDFTFFGNAKISTAISIYSTASLALDGTGDYVTLAHNSSISISAGDFTAEAFIRLGVLGKINTIYSKRNPSGNEYQIQVNASNVVECVLFNGTTAVLAVTGTTTVTTGVNYHVEFAWDASTNMGYIFLNGNLEASGTASGSPGSNTSALHIGRDPTVTTRHLNGYIGGLRFTRRVLHTSSFTAPAAAWPKK